MARRSACQDDTLDVGQPEVARLETVRQARVVDTEQVKHRCVQIVHGDAILNDVVPDVVRRANDGAGLDAASRQPHSQRASVVAAAAGRVSREADLLRLGSPAWISNYDNQSCSCRTSHWKRLPHGKAVGA